MEPMPLGSLALAVLVATVAVFVVSMLFHTVSPHHKKDWKKLPDEQAVVDALRKQAVEQGVYFFPHCNSMAELKEPETKARWEHGPVGNLTIGRPGLPSMGVALAQWTVLCFGVAFVSAYVARHAGLGYGAPCLDVMRITGSVAMAAFSMATFTESIWKMRPWRQTFVNALDGVVYGLVTALVFCWLWPGAP